MAKYRKIDPRIWSDEQGKEWKIPKPGKKLNPALRTGHAKIREFVFRRDNFTCVLCGKMAIDVPEDWDGRFSPYTTRGPLHLDHVIPRSKDGSNHPNNLQTLCESCNSRKGANHGA